MLDGQLARGDNAFGLVSDVQQYLVVVNLDDSTLDNVTIVEVLDGGIYSCEEVLCGSDIVDRNLRGVRRWHIKKCSE